MVIIRRFTEERVRPAPLPGVRAPRAGPGVGQGLFETASAIALQEKEKADRAAAGEAIRAAKAQRQSLMYAPGEGLALKSGQELFRAAGDAPSQYRQFLDQQLNGLANGRQQEYAREALEEEFGRFVDGLNRHEAQQLAAYYQGSYDSQQVSISDTAVMDAAAPGADWRGVTGRALEQMRFETSRFAEENPDLIGDVPVNTWVETEIKQRTSRHHAKTLDQLLAMPGGERVASEYLETYGEDLLPGDAMSARKNVAEKKRVATQQALYSEIDDELPLVVGADEEAMEAAGVDYRSPAAQLIERKRRMREKAKKAGLPAAEIDEAVEYMDRRSRGSWRDQKAAQEERYMDMWGELQSLGGDMVALADRHGKTLRTLSAEQMASLGEVAGEEEMDRRYDELVELAITQPANFNKLSRAEIHQQLKGDPGRLEEVLKWHDKADYTGQSVESALKERVDMLYTDAQEKAEHRVLLRKALRQRAAASGGVNNLKPDQVQRLLDQLQVEVEIDRKGFWRDQTVPVYELMTMDPRDVDWETVDELPDEDQEKIRTALAAHLRSQGASVRDLTEEQRKQMEVLMFVELAKLGAWNPVR